MELDPLPPVPAPARRHRTGYNRSPEAAEGEAAPALPEIATGPAKPAMPGAFGETLSYIR